MITFCGIGAGIMNMPGSGRQPAGKRLYRERRMLNE